MNALVLIGPPGAGKTTIGRELARRLGTAFLGTDEMIEAETGQTVSRTFIERGERAFRAIERRMAAKALAQAQASGLVVALGGGAPLDLETARELSSATVVFLDISDLLAARRAGFDTTRPLLAESPRKLWRELMARRRPVYEELADATVLVDGLSPAAVAGQIATMVMVKEQ
jgi:shikimate kinase